MAFVIMPLSVTKPSTMTKTILRVLVALTSMLPNAFSANAQKQAIELNRGWQFRLASDSSLNHVPGVNPEVDQATLQRRLIAPGP